MNFPLNSNHIRQQQRNAASYHRRQHINPQRTHLAGRVFTASRHKHNNQAAASSGAVTSSNATISGVQNGLAQQQQQTQQHIQTRSAELSDIPGFSYDPITRKYYKILENKPGQPTGSTLQHLRNLAVNTAAEKEMRKAQNRQNTTATSNKCVNLPDLLNRMQIMGTGSGAHQRNVRYVEDGRLRSVSTMPSCSFEVIDSWQQRFDSCQFLDVSEDGKTLLGCWSTERHDIFSAQCSRVLSFNVGIDRECAERDSRLADENPRQLRDTNDRYKCNTYGLNFEPLENGICLETSNQVLVDMVLAPADRDVTCLLFATAGSFYKTTMDGFPKIVTKCLVNLRPIEFNLSEEGRESMSSPIYNAEWTFIEPIWSLCFNSHHMKICVGMEKCARIMNVLNSDKRENFYVSSGGKNVISCSFSKDGNSLFLGRKCADISLLDLRTHANNHYIGELPGSASVGFMYLMRERPNTLLSESFDGKIKLWDLRMRRELFALEEGHRNSSHKLPCFVDSNERYIFAVGEDTVVRGWSLQTGELLCAVNSPRTYMQQKAAAAHSQQRGLIGGARMTDDVTNHVDFPRVVYSSSWGGRAGNSALVFAVNGDLLVHELLL